MFHQTANASVPVHVANTASTDTQPEVMFVCCLYVYSKTIGEWYISDLRVLHHPNYGVLAVLLPDL